MNLVTLDELLELFAAAEGFPAPVRDYGGLLTRQFIVKTQLFMVMNFTLSLDLKVAALMDSIARSHPLIDGNKRLTMLAAIASFALNERPLWRGTVEELENFILKISSGHLEVPEIARRLETIFVAN